MLVLSRDEGQSITIGDDIEITIIRSKEGQVRIGIEAPQDIQIWRSEVLEREADDAALSHS